MNNTTDIEKRSRAGDQILLCCFGLFALGVFTAVGGAMDNPLAFIGIVAVALLSVVGLLAIGYCVWIGVETMRGRP